MSLIGVYYSQTCRQSILIDKGHIDIELIDKAEIDID